MYGRFQAIGLASVTALVGVIAAQTYTLASPPLPNADYPRERLYSGRIDSDYSAESGLRYYTEGLAAENIIAAFTCDEIRFWVPQYAAAEWIARPDVERYWPTATLMLDGLQSPSFLLVELDLGEMSGRWIARVDWHASGADWMTPFATATEIKIETSAFEIVLSPAGGDPQNRAAFVETCLTL